MSQETKIVACIADTPDVPALVKLWERFIREERQAVPDADPQAARRTWSDRLKTQISKRQVVVARRNGEPVGLAGFLDSADRPWIPARVAYVVDVYLCPEARSPTAAKVLFDRLVQRAVGDFDDLWTNTASGNRRAQVLLERVGFVPLEDFQIAGLKDQRYFSKKLSNG